MLRITILTVSALGFSWPATAYAPVPFPQVSSLAGRWTVSFANGVIETCEVNRDGSAHVVEPNRASPGAAVVQGAAVVITFRDERVERWTRIGGEVVVEHWFPAATYPNGPKVKGVGRRAR